MAFPANWIDRKNTDGYVYAPVLWNYKTPVIDDGVETFACKLGAGTDVDGTNSIHRIVAFEYDSIDYTSKKESVVSMDGRRSIYAALVKTDETGNF